MNEVDTQRRAAARALPPDGSDLARRVDALDGALRATTDRLTKTQAELHKAQEDIIGLWRAVEELRKSR